MACKLAQKFPKHRKMRTPGGSRGPLKFRSFLLLIFEVYGMPFGCQLGSNLAPKTAPRRARGRKKGVNKQYNIEVYVGSRPELENETQNDTPDLNSARFSGPSWQDFQGFFKGFFRLCERSERSERSDVTPDTTRGRRKLRTNKTGLC